MDNQNQSQEVGKIVDIRKQVEEHVGQTIEITSQFGRKRENRHKVNLIETYATHFVIENIPTRGPKTTESYQYADILTQTILIHYPNK
ncbi:Veg family protein [Lactococcus ileimucosae]|uniref:Veg family protein n=1 Tax=Lactococcus ileimucosae TaxID=2941329 RepID=UPI0020432E0B|nr:Veg family protein [Lactococcus ileimucosae]